MSGKESWKLCAKWLDKCGSLPSHMSQHLAANQLTINEFAFELRNGEILCSLLDKLVPGSIDLTKVIRNSNSCEIFCLRNINLFLGTCMSNWFNLDEKSLFEADSLYYMDLSLVIKSLSVLSKCPASELNGCGGFLIDEQSIEIDPNSLMESTDGIGNVYAPIGFLLNLNQEMPHSQNRITDLSNESTLPFKESDYILRELLSTEETYLNVLKSLQSDYFNPLSKVLTYESLKSIKVNIDLLIGFHSQLYLKLIEACKGDSGKSIRICQVFQSMKKHFMEKYCAYFVHIDSAIEKVIRILYDKKLSDEDLLALRKLIDECQRKSAHVNFSLNDLLIQPFQRVTKYHLIFRDLFRKSEKNQEGKEIIKSTWLCMEEICNYLNECKKDEEHLKKIDTLKEEMSSGSMQQELNFNEYGKFLKNECVKKIRIHNFAQKEKNSGKKFLVLFEKALIIVDKFFNSYRYVDTIPIDEFSFIHDEDETFKRKTLSNNAFKLNEPNNSEFSISLYNSSNERKYELVFKYKKERDYWRELLRIVRPANLFNKEHKFTLCDFGMNFVECDVCRKYLNGIFFQGFKCVFCSLVAHKECMSDVARCDMSYNQEVMARLIKEKKVQLKKTLSRKGTNSFSDCKKMKKKAKKIVYKSIEAFNGEELSNSEMVWLCFEKNELIYVEREIEEEDKSDTSQYLYGYKLRFNSIVNEASFKVYGYFSKSSVLECDLNTELKYYPWFLESDRASAEKILYSIPNSSNETIFLVRSQNGADFKISLKYNGKIRNIQIVQSKFEMSRMEKVKDDLGHKIEFYQKRADLEESEYSTSANSMPRKKFFSICNWYFKSIVELVNFFEENALVHFSLNTTLGTPFRDAIPRPIYTAVATQHYKPNNNNIEIELKQSNYYFVLEESSDKLCSAFNQDGLVGITCLSFLDQI